jgi:hypothetical protein
MRQVVRWVVDSYRAKGHWDTALMVVWIRLVFRVISVRIF